MPNDDRDEDAPRPKKKPSAENEALKAEKKKTKPDGPAAVPPKRPSGTIPAKTVPEDDPPPKTKTKRVAKDAAGKDAAGKDAPPEDAEAPPAEESPKTKTGKRPRPEGVEGAPPSKGPSGKGKRPGRDRPVAPPPAPAVRGGFDYALAGAGPVLGGGLGTLGFVVVKQALDRLATNPIVGEVYEKPLDLPVAMGFSWATAFVPAPIIVGVVVGLLVTLCALKMAPGTATRIMAVGVLAFTVLSTLPFALAGRQLNAKVVDLVGKRYAIPRNGAPDPRALDLKAQDAADFPLRALNAAWKVDLDEGETPVAWLATAEDMEPSKDEKLPENERVIRSAPLRVALASCRELAPKFKAGVEALQPRLEALRDKVAAEVNSPSEETQKLAEAWAKFEGRCKKNVKDGGLDKPPGPKGAAWFTRFRTFGDVGDGVGTSKADRAFYSKRYLGKAIHKACPQIPAEVRYVGAFQVEVPLEFVGKDAAEQALTRFDFVFVCYDLEKPDREPIVVPYIKGALSDLRFAVEVLGQK